jgi:hypothetical protein
MAERGGINQAFHSLGTISLIERRIWQQHEMSGVYGCT